METKDFSIKIKNVDESGTFTGFAAVYGEVDLQEDCIERGSFTQSIQTQGNGYPLLWAHQQSVPIGIAKIEDSASALIVKGTIDRQDPDGERSYQRAKKGYVRGISIGFTIPRGRDKIAEKDGVRYLREIRLHELSLVAVPAQPNARITAIKGLGDVPEMLKRLDPEQIPDEVLFQLREIDNELKYLLSGESGADKAALIDELKRFATELQRVT